MGNSSSFIIKNLAGLYLHIPFCKKACHYCNFHFSTSLRYKSEMVEAIIKEIELQKDYLNGATLNSVYFGGGTPSLLSQKDLFEIFEQINRFHTIAENAEITLEANPDDLTLAHLTTLKSTPINRLSIGVQSFSDEDLKFMNRAHNTDEAQKCIENALNIGFEQLTIDLIYGTPTMNDVQWQANLNQIFKYNIPHLSCYALTVEPKTALDSFVKKGKVQPIDEEQTARQFETLVQQAVANGYEHYEISNFAKPNQYAKHNTAYWLGASYLGVGPSAHSFNGHTRQWNIAHNQQYLTAIKTQNVPFEIEHLTLENQHNEYIMTALRTHWGCDVEKLAVWNIDFKINFIKKSMKYIENGMMKITGSHYILTTKGKLLADNIMSDLFV